MWIEKAACSHTDLTSKQTPICCSYRVTYLLKDAHWALFLSHYVFQWMNTSCIVLTGYIAWSASVILEKRVWMKWCRGLAPITEGVLQSWAFLTPIRVWINGMLRQSLKFRISAPWWLSIRHFVYFDSNSLVWGKSEPHGLLNRFIRSV